MKLSEIFCDGMVLQHSKPVRIYGEGSGEISVAFCGRAKTVEADGRWCVEFPAQPIGGPYVIRVQCGKEIIDIRDIMIGEVILCSGQSNMEFTMSGEITPPEEYVSDPLLRTFVSTWSRKNAALNAGSGWVKCERETVEHWSAIAYHLGLEIRRKHKCAVGMVVSSLGATTIQTWMDEKCWFDSDIALPVEQLKHDYREPNETYNVPSACYHDALERLIPYSFAGAVFYQGESNTNEAEGAIYDKMLNLMVTNWREAFLDEALPFTIVQIVDYDACDDFAGWQAVQDAQLRAAEWIPALSTVISTDICENDDVHPKTKWKLAHRIYEDMTARGILAPALTLRPGEIFRDGMVLQHDKPVRVFGDAVGEVTVTFLGDTKTVSADGKWLVEFPARPCGGPYEMTIACGDETVTIRDIMIGEVILFSGQSNIQFHVNEGKTPPAPLVDDDMLRIFVSERQEPDEFITPADGWVKATPDSVPMWSALAYFAGAAARRKLSCAVGVIACSQGASSIQAWIDEQVFEGKEQLAEHKNKQVAYTWNYTGLLYHFMLERLLPYSIGCVVWYQGERNAMVEVGADYGEKLEMLITSWREAMRDEALPFCIVQLPDYIGCNQIGWASVQQVQMEISERVPYTLTVVSRDICEADDVHPPTKWLLGARIFAAMHEKGIV